MKSPEFEGTTSRILKHAGGQMRALGAARTFTRLGRRQAGGLNTARAAQPRTMVKAKFSMVRTKAGKPAGQNVQRVKDSARYYAHRPDRNGERVYRPGFTSQQGECSKSEVARFIEEQAKDPLRGHAYRLVLSPGVEMSEEQIKDWTRATLERHGVTGYMAFAHAGEHAHTEHAHVHVLTFRQERLNPDDFRALRSIGDEEEDKQLKVHREVNRQREPDRDQQHQGVELGV